MNTTKRLIEQLQKLTNKKVLLKEDDMEGQPLSREKQLRVRLGEVIGKLGNLKYQAEQELQSIGEMTRSEDDLRDLENYIGRLESFTDQDW